MARKIAIVIIVIVIAAFGAFYLLNLGKSNNATPDSPVVNNVKPFQVLIVNKIPHDTSAFTEGLFIHNGWMYESTGNEGKSTLRKIETVTGRVVKQLSLKDEYFGEGISLFNNKIYQLTYRNNIAIVYNESDFSELKKFNLPFEGWGMTTDSTHLIISNGTNEIYFYNPETFTEVKRISVSKNNSLLNNINELEMIDGYIYANVWLTKTIVKIDPTNGNVVAEADLSNVLYNQFPAGFNSDENTMNGIAYDVATKKIYITGKNWPWVFEVKFQ